MDALVSIIVTSYNHAEYLDQRMKTLLNQTYKNIEIIVIDDCSSDNSLEVLEKYRGNTKVEIFAGEKNQGYAKACNSGVEKCHGEYIMFAECDDYNEPTHIEVLMNAIHNNKSTGVAFCRSNMVDSQGKRFGSDFDYRETEFKKLCASDTLIPQEKMQKYFLIACVIPNMSAALISKKHHQMINGLSSDYKACSDWDFWCRISQHCDFYYITKSLNNFRHHENSVRSTFSLQLQVNEMYALLYAAAEKINLTFTERLIFRINMGFIWSIYLTSAPFSWMKSFPGILIGSFKWEKLNVLFLFLGLVKKGRFVIQRLLTKMAFDSSVSNIY